MDSPHLWAIAIDPEQTTRRENAIALSRRPDGWLLHVALADRDAPQCRMGTFSEDFPCAAIVLSVHIDRRGNWSLQNVRRALVQLTAAYTFSEACEAVSSPDSPQLNALLSLSSVLRGRLSPGGGAAPVATHPAPAFGLAMMATNAAAADFLWRAGVPACYSNYTSEAGLDIATEPTGHEAVGMNVYARFTAPLRRTDDRINLACLVAAFLGESNPFPKERIQSILNLRGARIPEPLAPAQSDVEEDAVRLGQMWDMRNFVSFSSKPDNRGGGRTPSSPNSCGVWTKDAWKQAISSTP